MLSDLIEKIAMENGRFVNAHAEDYFQEHRNAQNPIITLVTCSDSRVQLKALIEDPVNQIFAVENAGNQLHTSLGSVDYGVLKLKTPLLIILGHPDCGAIKAFMHGYADAGEAIRNELDQLRGVIDPGNGSRDDAELVMRNVQRNLDYQVANAVRRYRGQVQDGSLAVLGMIYDFWNYFGQGYGRVVLGNLNGETDLARLGELPLVMATHKPCLARVDY